MIRIAPRGFCAAALAGSLFFAGSASAQPKLDPAEQAAQFFDKGTALYKQSRWAEAEVQFQKAWDLRKSFDVAANLGDCELEIGQNAEAAEHMQFAVKEFPLTGKPALRERLQQRFAQARARVGALEVRVSIPGAQVSVDGHVIGLAPLAGEVFVEPGAHVVDAQLGEYEQGRARVEVGKGATAEVTLALVKKDATAPSGPNKPIVITGGAVTGVLLVTGAVLAVVAHGKASDADTKLATLGRPGGAAPCAAHVTTCSAIDSDRAMRDKLANASMGVFIGASAVGLATLGYALFAPRGRPATSGMRVVPLVGAGQGGVALMGAW